MATRGVEMTVSFLAWDTAANAAKTGDSGNFTTRWIKDGTASAPTNSVSEVDATNAPGVYKVTLTSTETDANIGTLAGKSSTASVSLIPTTIQFERLPNAAPGAASGVSLTSAVTDVETKVDTVDSNVDAILVDTGTTIPATIATVDTVVDGIKAVTDNLPDLVRCPAWLPLPLWRPLTATWTQFWLIPGRRCRQPLARLKARLTRLIPWRMESRR